MSYLLPGFGYKVIINTDKPDNTRASEHYKHMLFYEKRFLY